MVFEMKYNVDKKEAAGRGPGEQRQGARLPVDPACVPDPRRSRSSAMPTRPPKAPARRAGASGIRLTAPRPCCRPWKPSPQRPPAPSPARLPETPCSRGQRRGYPTQGHTNEECLGFFEAGRSRYKRGSLILEFLHPRSFCL